MKRIYLIIALVMCFSGIIEAKESNDSTANVSQQWYRNVYGELNGPSNWLGVAFDSRILPGSPFGYRAGISYISNDSYRYRTYGVGIPLELNCILGKRASKFECGIGVDLIFYQKDLWIGSTVRNAHLRSGFGYYTYFNIGYRLQRKCGFNFRAGISPSFAWGEHAVYKGPGMYLCPYLSFGYTIPNK